MQQQQSLDRQFMLEALQLADQAAALGEVPVGAVVVQGNGVIGRGHNQSLASCDPTAHAEVIALRDAARQSNNFRLDGSTLYVTIEPCLMCCGALLQARITRLVFGAREPRTGAVVSTFDTLMAPAQTHHVAITEGVMQQACVERIQRFFTDKR
jgi:tRNA(adenine34) deaminase